MTGVNGKQVKLHIINKSSLPADFQKCLRCQNRGKCKFIYRCFKIRETIMDGVEMEANVWSSGDEYAIVKNEKGVTFKFLNFGTKSWDVYVAAGALLCYMQQLNLSKQYIREFWKVPHSCKILPPFFIGLNLFYYPKNMF